MTYNRKRNKNTIKNYEAGMHNLYVYNIFVFKIMSHSVIKTGEYVVNKLFLINDFF